MKIYLFNTEDGLYLGEDYADDAMAGGLNVPAGATAIAPPPYGRREVPVFVAAENRWVLQPLSATRRP
ncbi:hypothetical protein KP004_19975 [Geomonas oryzisoli]|uniref:Tail fiber assembly protein n=1 Tax=Geomonas oryzisoli TaxID=2847992 RepID=A0ABX8J4P5_9BACT|nr:hypothetical protein [Geomonas oryzisoli]QWV93415.1 hypothetical protein KP004_19975 [Geomonas oryzisoli]